MRLELLELPTHLVDGGVELLDTIVQLRITDGLRLALRQGTAQSMEAGLPQLLQMMARLATALGGGQQPPGQACRSNHGSGQGGGHHGTAAAGMVARGCHRPDVTRDEGGWAV
jgi:hypothetical protein